MSLNYSVHGLGVEYIGSVSFYTNVFRSISVSAAFILR